MILPLAAPFRRFRPAADRRLEYGALAAVTLVGFVLRLSYLDVSMHWGEAVIARWTRDWPFLQVATYYGNVGNHLLHTLLVDLCHALFGPQPWSVRLPALLPGVALIPATFLVASKLFSRGTALVAAGLAAGSPYLAHYSINSRGYMLQSLLILLLTWLLIRVAESPSRRAMLAAGVVGALALHTLPTTIYVLPGLYAGAALWTQGGGGGGANPFAGGAGRLLSALFVTGSLALVLYLPVLLTNEWEAMTTSSSVLLARSFSGTWRGIVDRFVDSAGHWTWGLPFPVPALCALAAGAGLLDAVRRRASSALLVLLAVASTAVVALLLRRVPQVRGHLFLMPFFLIVLAAGIEGVLRRIPAGTRLACPLAAVLLAAGGTAWTWSAGWNYALRSNPEGIVGAESAVRVLATVMGGRDTAVPGFPQLEYYAELHGLPVRFRDALEHSDDVDNVYLLVRSHRETLREVIERRGFDRGFGEPRLFGVFPDLQVFVLRKELVVLGGDWYPEEGTSQSRWRWTGRTATVSFPNPRADATFHLDYAARPNLFGEAPQVVTISVGGRVLRSFAAAETGRRRLRIPVPTAALRPGRMTEVRIAVDRTFVPAEAISGSSDRRELGIQVHHAGPFPP